MSIHDNYEKITPETKEHVDRMYSLIVDYANEHGIKLAYNDIAEELVEAIATYLVNSEDER